MSPVQNSEIVLYCRLMRLKNVVAVKDTSKKVRRTQVRNVTSSSLSSDIKQYMQ